MDGVRDLFWGMSCVGCACPGRLLCRSCHQLLPRRPEPVALPRAPAVLGPVWATARHEGAVQALIVGHKERDQLQHARVLGGLLALAVGVQVRKGEPVVLVPVPSARAAVRTRGHDAIARMTQSAARVLRTEGHDVSLAPLLQQRGAVADQAGLTQAARQANLARGLWCPSARLRALSRRRGRGVIVVCDDVVTSGATLAEAARALAAVGVPVRGSATVARAVLRGRLPQT